MKPIIRLGPAPDLVPVNVTQTDPQLKTLAEIKATDPYDFPVRASR